MTCSRLRFGVGSGKDSIYFARHVPQNKKLRYRLAVQTDGGFIASHIFASTQAFRGGSESWNE